MSTKSTKRVRLHRAKKKLRGTSYGLNSRFVDFGIEYGVKPLLLLIKAADFKSTPKIFYEESCLWCGSECPRFHGHCSDACRVSVSRNWETFGKEEKHVYFLWIRDACEEKAILTYHYPESWGVIKAIERRYNVAMAIEAAIIVVSL